MLRLRVFVFLLSVWSFTAFSQAKITVGDPYDVIDADWKSYFCRNGEIMTVKINKKNSVVIQKMNANTLKFLKMRSYEDFPKGASFERITKFRDHYYVFYSLREDKDEGLYAREIDFVSGTFKGASQKIIAMNEVKMSGTKTKSVFGFGVVTADKYDFYFSNDSSALIVQYRLVPEKKSDSKSYDLIGTHVFEPTMKEKWGGVITMPYTEKKMDNLDYAVDAAGNVFVAARVFDDNSAKIKKVDGEPNYHVEVLRIEAGTGKITTQVAELAGKFIQTLWLYETRMGGMIGAGIYHNGNYTGNADGFVLFKFGSDGKLTDGRTYEIPLDVLNQYTKARTQRRNERKEENDEAEMSSLGMSNVLLQDDGGLMLVGEQEYTTTSTSTSRTGATSRTITYHFDHVLIARIDVAGKLAWMKKLPKFQHGPYPSGSMSYRYVRGMGKHNFLYVDELENLNLAADKPPVHHADWKGGGLLTHFQIDDKTGEVKKFSVFDTRDVEGIELRQFSLGRMLNTVPNTIVLEAYKKKKEDVLIKAVLNK